MNENQPRKELSLVDSTSLIVGIIIGVGIYQMTPDIAKGAGSGGGLLLLWVAGGLLSLCGALGYAELASAYPHQGGDYVYLGRAYGRWAGFLFAWVQLVIVRPGDIAVMAFAFATYARAAFGIETGWAQRALAAAAVLAVTGINVLGVRQGKWTQNLLTAFKAMGLLAIFTVALVAPPEKPAVVEVTPLPLSLALIFVLFTFGGWNEMAYVAAEVRHPQRNLVRALVRGTVAVTALYLLANVAFLRALGYAGVANSKAVASDTIAAAFPDLGAKLISALVCVSALGALNGLVLTGARISYAVGADHRVFRRLGAWDARRSTPVPALLLQGLIAVVLIVALGSFMDAVLYTAPAVYSFFLGTTLAVVILRRKDPARPRPYRVTWFPLPTVVFSVVCGWLIYSSVAYKPWIALAALGVALLGLPVYRYSVRQADGSVPERG
ncbi:MAG: amino acid permease [Verrucomicrobiales bacterium]|nr:amino acid permease [Verrucomicrobiales bacterium]MCP5526529.1 amino acid permease [Verrucomicrobiales bacterium]